MFYDFFHEERRFKKTTELGISRLILAIGTSAIHTIFTLYMKSFGLTVSEIGFLSAALMIVSLVLSFYTPKIISKYSEYKTLILGLLLYTIAYFLLFYYYNFVLFLVLAFIITIASVLRFITFAIIFKNNTSKKDLNKDEGTLYSLVKGGWLIGPLIAGLISKTYGISYVFLLGSVSSLLSVVLIVLTRPREKSKKEKPRVVYLRKILKEYVKKKGLIVSFLVTAGVGIWWALIYVYIPLFIVKNGLSDMFVGIFLSAIMVPLVLLEFKAGELSRKYGFRKFFFYGYLLLTLILFLCFLYSDIYFVLFLLFLGSFPMAFIEPLEDSFFFSNVTKKEEEEYYPIFSPSRDIGKLIGKLVVAVTLLFLPLNFAYLSISIILGFIALASRNIYS